jgi:hypothetical protein
MSSACTLAEVVTAEPADLLVVEAVLRSDAAMQRVMLHGPPASPSPGLERGARVTVRNSAGREVVFVETQRFELCLEGLPGVLPACYVSPVEEGFWVRPGEEYELSIETADGRRAFGRTTVPGEFRVLEPAALRRGRGCHLPPGTPLPLVWSRSSGTWTYLADMEIFGLPAALAGRVPAPIPDRVRLTGLAISETDTTMILPRDFGIFQRTEYEQPLLLALRDGLPVGVTADLVLAAVDRNFVNAVRGGTFNPSGRVRIPSVAGDATGLFGSMTAHTMIVDVRRASPFPSCLGN